MKITNTIYQRAKQAVTVFKLFYSTMRIWKFKEFVKFWTGSKKKDFVILNGIKISIRQNTIFEKISDLCMAYECIVRDDYKINKISIMKSEPIIDIGSHIGSFSLMAALKFPESKIFSYEPSKININQFKKNIKLNKADNIKVNNLAVSGKKDKIKLFVDRKNFASNSTYKKTSEFIEVNSITLKDIFENNNIQSCGLIKIDCEGAEYDILMNTPVRLLAKIRNIVLEYHEPAYFGITKKEYTPKRLIKYLKNAGFNVKMKKVNRYQGLIFAKLAKNRNSPSQDI